MSSARFSSLLLSAAVILPSVCAQAGEPAVTPVAQAAAPAEPGVLVGTVTREQIEAASPEWVKAEVEAAPDAAAAQELTNVPPGAEVTVFLGTWCGYSRRVVPRLWKALDAAGGSVPFHIRYVAVDRQKKEPAGEAAADQIQYVPTLIVARDGRELGRIIEQSPHGVEKDLLALLQGQAHGVVSASHPDVPPSSSH
jgi:thiol-disulfide isomerase/thioredoxin